MLKMKRIEVANDHTPFSPHALVEPRQMAYEVKRRAFQAAQGREVRRMTRNRW